MASESSLLNLLPMNKFLNWQGVVLLLCIINNEIEALSEIVLDQVRLVRVLVNRVVDQLANVKSLSLLA